MNVTCKCPDCGRKTNGVAVREENFSRRAAKKGIGTVVGGVIGSILAPGVGTAIGAAIGSAAQCTDAYNDITNNALDPMFKKGTSYKYHCSCGRTWTYSAYQAERKHKEMLEADARKAAWMTTIIVMTLIVAGVHVWLAPDFFEEASAMAKVFTVLGYSVGALIIWKFVFAIKADD